MSEELLTAEDEVLIPESGGNFILPPPGNHMAICVGIVMIGTVEEEYQGHKKKQKKIRLGFELPEKKHVFDDAKGPEPFIVWKEYTFSLARLKNNKKTNLRNMLEGWRGSEMTDDEAKKFNILALRGCPCRANVLIKKSKNANEYVDIASISMIEENAVIPEQITPDIVFTFAKPFKTEQFNRLSEWVQNRIKTSDEYKALAMPNQVEAKTEQQANPQIQTTVKKGKFPFQ